MLKIKQSQSFLDELEDVDWFDDEQDDLPSREQGFVTQDNYEEFEPRNDDVLAPYDPDARSEIPLGNEMLGIPRDTNEVEYSDPIKLIDDGMEKQEVISFEYTNRFGAFAGLRTVEPHYTFIANTTNNEILVTFDRDSNAIRAFIVGNIHPFGVRYEDVHFIPKTEIMRGVF